MNLAAQQQLVGNESGGALDPWRFLPLLYEAMETADTRDQLMRAVLNVIRDTEYVVSCWAARREAAGALVVWDDRITADGHVIDSATTRAFAAVEDETLVRACQNSASVLLEHIPGFQAAIIILRGAKDAHGALVVVSHIQTGTLPGAADLDIFGAMIGNALETFETHRAGRRLAMYFQALCSFAAELPKARSPGVIHRHLCRAVTGNGLFSVAQIGRSRPGGRYQPLTALSRHEQGLIAPLVAEPLWRGGESLMQAAWRTGEIQSSNDHANDQLHLPEGHRHHHSALRATAAVPILRNGQVYAVLLAGALTAGMVDAALEQFLLNVVSLAGQAEAGIAMQSRLRTERKARLAAEKATQTAPSVRLATPRPQAILHQSLLSAGGLVSHYQPVIDIRSGKVRSVEALARLSHDKLLIPPGTFLPDFTAADRHLLFRNMVENACIDLNSWAAEDVSLAVSVNVDADTLMLETTLPMLIALLKKHGIARKRLTLEILETTEFPDLGDAARMLSRVREAGIKVALDDVGAGYSSMLKVRQLPLDVIKLDRAFLVPSTDQPDGLAFIRLHQTLARDLGLELIVEGVETVEMLHSLDALGVDQAQGYGICRPMSGPALLRWLKDDSRNKDRYLPTALDAGS